MIVTMSMWDETLLENESDAREQLDEPCHCCGTRLARHYDSRGEWIECCDLAPIENHGYELELQLVTVSREEK